MWKHKSKYKGHIFLGTYEYDKKGKRILKLKNRNTGREIGKYGNAAKAREDGWVYEN